MPLKKLIKSPKGRPGKGGVGGCRHHEHSGLHLGRLVGLLRCPPTVFRFTARRARGALGERRLRLADFSHVFSSASFRGTESGNSRCLLAGRALHSLDQPQNNHYLDVGKCATCSHSRCLNEGKS